MGSNRYVQFDPAVIEQARQIDLLSYLQRYEPGNLKRVAGNVYCTKEHDSLKISNGKWYWWSRGFGGFSALDYLMKVREFSFVEAVQTLTGDMGDWKPPPPAVKKDEPKVLLLPPRNKDSDRVLQYLFGRGIDYAIVQDCIADGTIYESADYHNAVFIGKDESGTPKYAACRGTMGSFKRDASGSDKRYSFRLLAREPTNTAPDTPANAGEKAKSRFIKTRQQGKQTIKTTARNAEKTVKSTAQGTVKTREAARAAAQGAVKSKEAVKAATKSTVKTAEKGIKTAQTTSKAAIKTTEQTAKATKAAAKTSVKTAQKAAQAAKATAKATAHAIKAAVKATIAAIKAIIAGTKALIAAIMAGGWIAVAVILIICLIGLLVGSVFGIFFSGEDSGNGMTMQTVVREINADYDSRLDEIINGTSHNVLEMSGSRAVWKEVLAVYSVKTTTDPDNPQEVATMDDNKKQLLKDIFWEMNEISFRTESKTETQITESDDGHGNIVETETTVTQTYLYITMSHKTAEEMADRYGFNEEQRQQLSELLAEENNSLWSAVLYGITIGDGEIVTVALSQVGNAGGEPYWSWYGFDGRVEWCACFVSWCADQCGYIDSGVIPKFAGCVNGSQWFKDRGQWQEVGFTPEAGQIIFFDWEGDGETDHVGIVERCENGIVYTVEGNSGDACRQRSYPVGSRSIYGYGIPAY